MISASVVLLAAIVAALLYLAYETIRKTTKLLLTYVPSARNLRILQLCPAISEVSTF